MNRQLHAKRLANFFNHIKSLEEGLDWKIDDNGLHGYKFYRHEEGWSEVSVHAYYENGKFIELAVDDGTDCDGRTSNRVLVQFIPINGGRWRTKRLDASKYDQYAEMAGY